MEVDFNKMLKKSSFIITRFNLKPSNPQPIGFSGILLAN